MPEPTADEVWAELQQVTTLSQQEWLDVLALPADQQGLVLSTYRHMDWTRPGTSTFDRVLTLLGIVGTIAGVVGGVAGAVAALKAL